MTRARAGLGVGGLALAVLAIALLARGGAQGDPPDEAARLVPADALVYLHLSTDTSRDSVRRAGTMLDRFARYPALRDSLLARLSAGAGPVDVGHDVAPWLGDEAALALLNSSGPAALSLVLVKVTDRARARAFLRRSSTVPTATDTYRGVTIERYGRVVVAFVGRFLAVGQDAALRAAIDLAGGRGVPLAGQELYRSAIAGRPPARVADAYITAAGVRRLLRPQGGLLGAVGSLLDQPALRASELTLRPGPAAAVISARNVLSPRLQAALPAPFRPFTPTLDHDVPSGAMAYLGVAGLDRAFGRLIAAARGGGGGLVALIARARGALNSAAARPATRDLAALLGSEVGVWIAARPPVPTLALIARTPDEARTRLDLARLQVPLAQAFTGTGQAPTFSQRRVSGVDVFSLRLAPAVELDYAVFSGRLVLATNSDAIEALMRRGPALASNPAYRAVAGARPKSVTSVVFLDFSQLLTLAEQTGLSSSPTYARIRDDLARIRAVGESSTAGQGQTNAQITLSIP